MCSEKEIVTRITKNSSFLIPLFDFNKKTARKVDKIWWLSFLIAAKRIPFHSLKQLLKKQRKIVSHKKRHFPLSPKKNRINSKKTITILNILPMMRCLSAKCIRWIKIAFFPTMAIKKMRKKGSFFCSKLFTFNPVYWYWLIFRLCIILSVNLSAECCIEAKKRQKRYKSNGEWKQEIASSKSCNCHFHSNSWNIYFIGFIWVELIRGLILCSAH